MEGFPSVFAAERIQRFLTEVRTELCVALYSSLFPFFSTKEKHIMPHVDQWFIEIAQPNLALSDSTCCPRSQDLEDSHGALIPNCGTGHNVALDSRS